MELLQKEDFYELHQTCLATGASRRKVRGKRMTEDIECLALGGPCQLMRCLKAHNTIAVKGEV